MEQFLYRIRPARLGMLTEGPTADEARIVSEHFAYLKALVEAGTVLMAGRTTNVDETTFGIAIFRAESRERAEDIVRNDPAVKHGVMRADLFPYRIALWSSQAP